ncbi:hypothetical protein M1L56_11430 [Agromyces sp. C10]|nr:hypothetical protein [Agromyces sp. C10]MCK8610050.1 hypothetical protein [Agromyces sp. C10]
MVQVGVALDGDVGCRDELVERPTAEERLGERALRRPRRGIRFGMSRTGRVDEHAVAHLEQVLHRPVRRVLDGPRHGGGEVAGPLGVQLDAREVEDHLGRHRREHVGCGELDAAEVAHAVPELDRGHQVLVAPRRVLGLVAELLERVGLELGGLPVRRVGEHDVREHLGDPAVVALVERRPGPLDDGVRPAHELDVASAGFGGRQDVQVRGMRVVPSEVPLVHGLGVVVQRPVVAVAVPLAVEARGQPQLLGDLGHGAGGSRAAGSRRG